MKSVTVKVKAAPIKTKGSAGAPTASKRKKSSFGKTKATN